MIDAWIKKMCYIYIIKYYLVTKRKGNSIGVNIDRLGGHLLK
jgi:hypothetical protein